MALEVGTYLNDLTTSWPVGSTDFIAQGDDHIRLLKSVIKNSFPGQNFPIASKDATETTANAYDVTLSPAPAAYVKYMAVTAVLSGSNDNTGEPTLNVNSLGAKTIKRTGQTPVGPGDLRAGQLYMFVYDGTYFICLNPETQAGQGLVQSKSVSSGTELTFTGLAALRDYELRITELRKAVAGGYLAMQVYVSGLVQTGTDYYTAGQAVSSLADQALFGGDATAHFQLTPGATGWELGGNFTGTQSDYVIKMMNLGDATGHHHFLIHGGYYNSTRYVQTTASLHYSAAGPVDGIKLFFSDGGSFGLARGELWNIGRRFV